MKTWRSLRFFATALVAMGAIAAAVVWREGSDGRGADRRQIQALLRELERDLNYKRRFEIFQHLAQVDPNELEPEQREHRLKDGLWELSRIKELRFSETEIGFSDESAMVETVVTGIVDPPGGFKERTRSRILLKLVKESDEWKIASKQPEGAVHRLLPFRSLEKTETTGKEE